MTGIAVAIEEACEPRWLLLALAAIMSYTSFFPSTASRPKLQEKVAGIR
jgi:hypothetical protein